MEHTLKIQPETTKRRENGTFEKGNIPHNKDKTGISTKKMQVHQYKKGNLPHNTKYDGYISLRFHNRDQKYYKYIRISLGVWKSYHNYIYEKDFGKIPKGSIIIFKDKDTLNLNINNLECITRAEHCIRNRNHKKAAKTLKETWNTEKLRNQYGLQPNTKLLERCKN